MRTRIKFTEDITEILTKMSEGNPGALTFLMEAINNLPPEQSFTTLMHLDDMNIRGSQIWIGYKHYCGCDTEKFLELVGKRDEGLVDFINQESKKDGLDEEARTHGASYTHKSADREFIRNLFGAE